MWSFVKKNIWLWRPGRSGNLYILSAALVLSCLDAYFPFPAEIWIVICALTVVLAQAAAASAMNDFKDDSYHFLEYLPIRWTNVWFSSWLDNLLSCVLVVPLLLWCRVLTWTSPTVSSLRANIDPLFNNRWTLPISLLCLAYFSFNYALMGRSLFKSAKATLLVALWGQIVLFAGAGVMLAFAMVLPGMRDLWPLLIAEGSIFAGCSFFILVVCPRHWSALRRFIMVGLPASAVTTALFFAVIWLECHRWRRLDWSETDLTASASVVPGDHPRILAEVESQRSMAHRFLCDPDSGAARFIGRNLLELQSRSIWQDEGSVIFRRSTPPIAWWPLPAPIIAVHPADFSLVTLMADASIDDGTGQHYPVQSVISLPKDRYVIVCGGNQYRNTGLLRVVGPNGQVAEQIEISSEANGEVLISESQRLVALAPMTSPRTDNDREYLLCDLTNGQEVKFKLPGKAICFSPDLTLCVCLVELPRGTMNDRQVVMASIPSGSVRVIIPAGILPPVPGLSAAYIPLLPSESPLSGVPMIDETAIMFDNTFSQMVFLLTRFDNSVEHHSLIYVDLATAARRTLLAESEMPIESLSRATFSLSMIGFTPDRSACIYRFGPTLTRVAIPTSTAAKASISEIHLPSDQTQVTFSPSGATVLLADAKSFPTGEATRCTRLVTFDRPNFPFQLASNTVYQFLDEQRLVSTAGSCVAITDRQGHVLRQLLPPPTK